MRLALRAATAFERIEGYRMRITFLRRAWQALAACSLTSTLVAPALGQVDPLSLDEALHLAAERSQQLVADSAAATAARERAVAAETGPDFVLTTGFENLPIEGPHDFSLTEDFMTMTSIGIERELVGGTKRSAEAARYTREAEAAEAARSLGLAMLQQQTAAAWFDRLYANRASELLAAQRASADSLTTAAEVAYGNGSGTQSDLLAAHEAVARSDDAIAAMQREVALARARLARWIGDDDALRPLASPPMTDAVAVHHGNIDEQLAQHPDLLLMRKREEVAMAEAEMARAARRPSWTVGVAYQERGSAYDDMMSVHASRPIGWRRSQRQDRVLGASLATAAQARAELEEETRAHLLEAHSLIETWTSNRARLERFATTLVPLAEQRVVAATAAYRAGSGALSDVLEARTSVIETALEQLTLEMETAKIWAELEYLIPHAVATL
jgi:outer membrane protein TolC